MILKADGTLWAAGYNGYGQFGDGTQSTTGISTPVQVNSDVIAVAAGSMHTMLIKTGGTLWAAGTNSEGQLGNSNTSLDRWTAIQVKPGFFFSSVSAGDKHTLMVEMDGDLWVTGRNLEGQLGTGNKLSKSTPYDVTYYFPTVAGLKAVSASMEHSVILKTDGSVLATGTNTGGRLGDDTITDRTSYTAALVTAVDSISAGDQHTMYVKTDHTLWAAGAASYWRLGDGQTSSVLAPKWIQNDVAAVSAGGFHTMILKTNGDLYGVGRNNYGQIGDGTKTDVQWPTLIMTGVAAISAGHEYTMILKTDGTLWATGRIAFGSFGDNNFQDKTLPVRVQ